LTLSDQLHDQIARYVRRLLPLAALRDWLSVRAESIVCSDDSGLTELADEVWTLLAEYDYGHRTEESIRTALASIVGQTAPAQQAQSR
jgi:hypothetical protein